MPWAAAAADRVEPPRAGERSSVVRGADAASFPALRLPNNGPSSRLLACTHLHCSAAETAARVEAEVLDHGAEMVLHVGDISYANGEYHQGGPSSLQGSSSYQDQGAACLGDAAPGPRCFKAVTMAVPHQPASPSAHPPFAAGKPEIWETFMEQIEPFACEQRGCCWCWRWRCPLLPPLLPPLIWLVLALCQPRACVCGTRG